MKTFLRFVLAGLTVLLIFMIFRQPWAADWTIGALHKLKSLGAWGAPLFVLLFILAPLLFVPVVILMMGGGMIFGFTGGAFLTSLAATFSAALDFIAGRYIFRERIAKKVSESPKLQVMDRAVGIEGWKIVGLSRLTAIAPFVVMNLFWGGTKVSFKAFVFATWIGMLPGILLYAYLGSAAADMTSLGRLGASSWMVLAVGILSGVGIFVVITRRAQRIFKTAFGQI